MKQVLDIHCLKIEGFLTKIFSKYIEKETKYVNSLKPC